MRTTAAMACIAGVATAAACVLGSLAAATGHATPTLRSILGSTGALAMAVAVVVTRAALARHRTLSVAGSIPPTTPAAVLAATVSRPRPGAAVFCFLTEMDIVAQFTGTSLVHLHTAVADWTVRGDRHATRQWLAAVLTKHNGPDDPVPCFTLAAEEPPALLPPSFAATRPHELLRHTFAVAALFPPVVAEVTRATWPCPAVGAPGALRPWAAAVVLDDDAVSQRVLAHLLQATGIPTVTTLDSASALNACMAEAWHTAHTAVFVDIVLPDGDGRDVTRRLRKDCCSAAFIVAVTATDNVGMASNTHLGTAGFDAVLRKPVSSAALQRVLLRCGHACGKS